MSIARRQFVGLLVAVLCAGGASAETWRTYQNPRFGTIGQYPAGWTMGPAPENDDGRVFTSPDGGANLTISGIRFMQSRTEEFAILLQPHDGETIVYRRQGPDWVVVSGTNGDRIFYRKSLLTCGVWNDMSLDYPAADKARFDPIVAHVAASLKGTRGADGTPCR